MSSFRNVRRTVDGAGVTVNDEPVLPSMTNIAGHPKLCNRKLDKNTEVEEVKKSVADELNLDASRKMLEGWLKDGDLDPDAVITKRGFLRLFAAWILDESLPWTTGEAPSLRLLFKYLKINHHLPSDTTVRNQLAHIFDELLTKVVKTFAVQISRFSLCMALTTNASMLHLAHRMRSIHGQIGRWSIPLPAP